LIRSLGLASESQRDCWRRSGSIGSNSPRPNPWRPGLVVAQATMRVLANDFLAKLAKAIRLLVSSSFKRLTLLLPARIPLFRHNITAWRLDEGRRKPPLRLDTACWSFSLIS